MTITRLGPSSGGAPDDGFLHALGSADKADLQKLESLRELPKPRYATKLAVTAYPSHRRARKAVFSHIEVFKMTENIAGALRESGVRPGTVCGVVLRNCLEALIYFFALEWIGAVAMFVDVDVGVEEMRRVCKQGGVVVLCTHWVDEDERGSGLDEGDVFGKCESVVEDLGLIGWHVYRTTNEGVVLDTHGKFASDGAAWAGGAGDFVIDPEETALHVVSRGGVVTLSHRAMTASAKSFVETYDLKVGMSTMLLPPLCDIHGILVLVASFYSGGHVVLPGLYDDAKTLLGYVEKHKISWFSAQSDKVLEFYDAARHEPLPDDSHLNMIRSCGGKLAVDVLSQVEDSLRVPVLESYGTPEAAGFAAANREFDARPGTCGKHVPRCDVAIFDPETKEPLPANVVGEIAVSGDNVAQSYYQDEEATQEAIYTTEVEDEDADDDSETGADRMLWFSTGDRGSIDENGYLSIVGDSKTMRAAEEEQESHKKEVAATAAAAAAAASAAAAAAAHEREREMRETEEAEAARRQREEEEAEARRLQEEEEARQAQEMQDRDAKLLAAGVANPSELDPEMANAILARIQAIEDNQRILEAELEEKNKRELEEARTHLAEAELAAERAARGEGMDMSMMASPQPIMMDVNMDELEAAVMAAAASAQRSANHTKEAVDSAKEVAAAAYGAPNRSRAVAIRESTGDQGSLTKTVRVALDDVESAMMTHPAVQSAKAFGRKDDRFGAEVFCAIVPKRGARVSEPWLKLHAQSVLPAPMVPKKFYYVKEMPMTLSRKELADSNILKDLKHFSGFSDVKHVKGPSWRSAKQKSKKRYA